MNSRVGWGIAAALTLLSAGIASAEPPGIVRAQSPAAEPAIAPEASFGPLIGSAPGYGELKKGDSQLGKKKDFKTFPQVYNHNFGYDGGYYSGFEPHFQGKQKKTYMSGGGCQYCQYGQACPDGGCQHCGCGCSKPKHYQTYEYKWPQNMVYPPPVLPAGMVQYPYYTLRGPSDFFMK